MGIKSQGCCQGCIRNPDGEGKFSICMGGRGVIWIAPIFPRPISYIENGIKRFFYIHIAYPNIFLYKISVLRILDLKKASKFDFFLF